MAAALHVAAVIALFVAAERHPRLDVRQRRIVWAIPAVALALALIVTGDVFVINKWLPHLVMPVGISWLMVVTLSCWRLMRGDRRLGGWLAATAFAIWLTSCNALAGVVLSQLEAGYALPAEDARLDALLVLGGGTNDGPFGAQLSQSGDRIATAARLHHRGVARFIVVGGTGVAALQADGKPRDLGWETSAILGELGVPEDALIIDPAEARNTREEVASLRALCEARGFSRVGLVTSAWHLPRAMRHARHAGLDAIPVPADYRGGVVWNLVEILPSANGALQMRLAAWELLGIALSR